MCEPSNSIVQYPTEDDSGSSNEGRLSFGLKELGEWLKRVGKWFHLSKMGKGHHESSEWANTNHLFLPSATKYEAYWWNREVRLDGYYLGDLCDRETALEAVTTYANAVSIGSLHALRNFLEVSMRKTEYPYKYVNVFAERLLNKKGREVFYGRLKCMFNCNNLDISRMFGGMNYSPRALANKFGNSKEAAVEKAIKVMLGFTRKRDLLVPEWSDDANLWTPGQIRDAGTPVPAFG